METRYIISYTCITQVTNDWLIVSKMDNNSNAFAVLPIKKLVWELEIRTAPIEFWPTSKLSLFLVDMKQFDIFDKPLIGLYTKTVQGGLGSVFWEVLTVSIAIHSNCISMHGYCDNFPCSSWIGENLCSYSELFFAVYNNEHGYSS